MKQLKQGNPGKVYGFMKVPGVLFVLFILTGTPLFGQKTVERWKIFQLDLSGPQGGNPFLDTDLSADFVHGNDTVEVRGFYDGAGSYKIRFMPDAEGEWKYFTRSNMRALNKKRGKFECLPAQRGNHGSVVVKDTFSFAYADGSPYFPFGTTCYAWVHQGDSLANLTVKTLSNACFNKMRMCIFPKSYRWNNNEPEFYPFEGKPLKDWDFNRFNPAFFRNIEQRIAQLDSLGIEADLIVFHPYDRWGFNSMDSATDDRYIQYIIARFAAYKNVWWSMANEFDLMKEKKMSDWDRYIKLFAENDPYGHLRSIHNGVIWYDHTNPLITHASVQSSETRRAGEYRKKYKKPVVFDECKYEGNIPFTWGNLTAESLTEKFWQGFLNGGFVGHGETYVTEKPVRYPEQSSDVLWWSKGGILRGESPARIEFLREIIESAPGYLQYAPVIAPWLDYASAGYRDEYYLLYFNRTQPGSCILDLPGNSNYYIEVIDTWNMTITPLNNNYSGKCLVELPSKPYIALRITKRK